MKQRIRDGWRLGVLSLRLVAGRRFWIAMSLPLIWTAWLVLRLALGWRPDAYVEEEMQNVLALPLAILAVGLGVRIVAGEIDRRTLEIAYTVPGGSSRVWLAKLAAAIGLLLGAEIVMTIPTVVFMAPVTLGAFYGAFQAAFFYLVLAMGLAALFTNEVAGMIVAAPLLFFGYILQSVKFGPFYNPAPLWAEGIDPADIVAGTVQNRLGYLLVTGVLLLLALARAERREKLIRA